MAHAEIAVSWSIVCIAGQVRRQNVSHRYKISQEKVTRVYMVVKKKTLKYYKYQYHNKKYNGTGKLR